VASNGLRIGAKEKTKSYSDFETFMLFKDIDPRQIENCGKERYLGIQSQQVHITLSGKLEIALYS
jgi:hypothetical protein